MSMEFPFKAKKSPSLTQILEIHSKLKKKKKVLYVEKLGVF